MRKLFYIIILLCWASIHLDAQCNPDTEAPSIQNCPTDTCVVLAPDATVAIIDWTFPEATDNCSDENELTWFSNGYLNPTGVFGVGTTMVEYTVSDQSGNISAPCSFEVEIKAGSALTFYPVPEDRRIDGNWVELPIRVNDFEAVTQFNLRLQLTPTEGVDSIVVIQNPQNPEPVDWSAVDAHTVEVDWVSQMPNGQSLSDSTAIFGLRLKLSENEESCHEIIFPDALNATNVTFASGLSAKPQVEAAGFCVSPQVWLGGHISRLDGSALANIQVNGPGFGSMLTDEEGRFRFDSLNWQGNYQLNATYDVQPLNGVNVGDIVLIRDHILGISSLENGYARIKADVDQSQRLTIIDLVLIGQLILGYSSALPADSWIFIPTDYNLLMPMAVDSVPNYTENRVWPMLQNNVANADFYGLKMGDVDESASSLTEAENTFSMLVEDQYFKKGDIISFSLPVNASLEGLQANLNIDHRQLKLLEVVSREEESLQKSKSNSRNNHLQLLWVKHLHHDLTLRFEALQSGHLAQAVQLESGMAVDQDRVSHALQLHWKDKAPSVASAPERDVVAVQPNPFQEQVQLQFVTEAAQDMQLVIYDAAGRVVHLAKAYFPKGRQYWELDEKIFPETGLYFFQLTGPNHKIQGKLIKK